MKCDTKNSKKPNIIVIGEVIVYAHTACNKYHSCYIHYQEM